jgi:lathosterol oxidase
MNHELRGLLCGLACVLGGQIIVILYYVVARSYLKAIKGEELSLNFFPSFYDALLKHVCNVEGLFLLGFYLSVTYLGGGMPASYYSWKGGIQWSLVTYQLLIQDFLQYCTHRCQHLFTRLYQNFHQQHHRYRYPKLLDAFSGSIGDTLLMVIVPLWITSRIVHANVWSYMVFGTIYSSWLMLIHCEYHHPWDFLFQKIGFGTAQDHHRHHQFLKCNYGHLFMYWDWMLGTYSS